MKRLVEFPLEDGGAILAEVDGMEPTGSRVRGGSPSEIAEKARQTFESSLEKIKPAAAPIIAKLRDLSDQPEQVSVEFGVKLKRRGRRSTCYHRSRSKLQSHLAVEASSRTDLSFEQ